MAPITSARAPASTNDRLVLEALRAADGPLTAYAILDRLRPDRPRIAPPTVYRAIDHLVRAGLVRRIESLHAYLPSGPGADGPVAYAICDDCGRVEQREAGAAVEGLTSALAEDGFVPTRPVIELHGRCGACGEAAAS